jgi:hypothetical protein
MKRQVVQLYLLTTEYDIAEENIDSPVEDAIVQRILRQTFLELAPGASSRSTYERTETYVETLEDYETVS